MGGPGRGVGGGPASVMATRRPRPVSDFAGLFSRATSTVGASGNWRVTLASAPERASGAPAVGVAVWGSSGRVARARAIEAR